MNTAARADFRGRFAPFEGLEPAEREAIAAAAAEREYDGGEAILLEDGTPSEHLFVVRDGSVELVHQAEVVDVLGPGESFGHPSLLSGLAPAFTVRARERTACILIPREAAVAVFSAPAGPGYLVAALPELGAIRVAGLIGRPPIFCGGAVTIQRAAQLMTDDHASAILVRDGGNLSILTDAVLRERVVAGEMSAGSPVSLIVRPAVQVGPERIAVDAVVEMLAAGTDHIVVVDETRQVLGVLSATDLAGLETRSPFALRHAILQARDEPAPVAAAQRLRPLFLALLDAGVG